MLDVVYLAIIIGLIILFFVSLFMFIKRILGNSTIIKSIPDDNKKSFDLIIEQNKKIISLLEQKRSD